MPILFSSAFKSVKFYNLRNASNSLFVLNLGLLTNVSPGYPTAYFGSSNVDVRFTLCLASYLASSIFWFIEVYFGAAT